MKSATIGAGVLSIGSDVFNGKQPAKVIWLTNTPPSGYSNAAGRVNYVANNQYSSLSNKTVYPLLSSLFEVGGVVYAPISLSERTCDAIDCLYDEQAEHINIGEKVTYMNVDSDMADDDYTMTISSELTAKEGATSERIIAADSQATLTVTSVQPGDVNGDGDVTVTDVVIIISYALNDIPNGFIFAAGDLNGDGVITVTDVVIAIDIALQSGSSNNSRQLIRQEREPQ